MQQIKHVQRLTLRLTDKPPLPFRVKVYEIGRKPRHITLKCKTYEVRP